MMKETDPKKISIIDFDYPLPEDRIALFPLESRDASKLLVYQHGEISAHSFSTLPNHLHPGDLLVFNNSRVINARLKFQKPTGGVIEIFCLEPSDALVGYTHSLSAHETATWKCLVGGISKWKSGVIKKEVPLHENSLTLTAEIEKKWEDAWVIQFRWNNPQYSFLEILEATGQVPLPPYLKRNVDESDHERYQTIYASAEGSVAAPTAGLHFTPAVLDDLKKKGIGLQELTLHVGAGTFKPVNAPTMNGHSMHAEWIEINRGLINNLLHTKGKIVAVGTTSLRSLETIYWIAKKISIDGDYLAERGIGQWEIYEEGLIQSKNSKREMLEVLLQWMSKKGIDQLYTPTRLLITPGYKFRVVDALVTNFHQPKSTLLLLVAAATDNAWRKLYAFAMENQFRFLSYGDSSLIIFDEQVKAG